MKFQGYDGEIELGSNAITIKKGKKDTGRTFPLSNVVSVTLIKPKLTMAGCIHIQILGAKTYPAVGMTAVNYAMDVNAICFRKPQYEEAVAFKDAIDKALADRQSGEAQEQMPPSNIDMLRQLKSLLDEGIISQDDYDKKKAQLLGI